MSYQIYLSKPNIFNEAKGLLNNCIDQDWVSSAGKYVEKFEKKISNYTKSKYVVACSSGTSALQISQMICGIKEDDEVIVPTLTFIATINSIIYNNAIPIFMDCDNFFNLDVKKTIEFIESETVFKKNFTYNKKTNRRISTIIPVHVWGNAVNLEKLINICKRRNINIIEDASESLGTIYNSGRLKGKHTGTIGKVGCLSFNGNKILTTGGGGAILTNIKKLAEKAKYLTTQAKDDTRKFIHNEVGFNYRLSNLHAAVGIAQFENFKKILKSKHKINKAYSEQINKIPGLSLNNAPCYAVNNRWLNILRINPQIYQKSPSQLLDLYEKNKIETRHVWRLNHLQKPYIGYQRYKINNAPNLVDTSLCLPSGSDTTIKQINKICSLLK